MLRPDKIGNLSPVVALTRWNAWADLSDVKAVISAVKIFIQPERSKLTGQF